MITPTAPLVLNVVYCLLFLLRGCYADTRTGLWKASGSSSHPNMVDMSCIVKFMDMKHGAVRMQTEGGGLCEKLPYTWLTNPTYSSAYSYMTKDIGKRVMLPPFNLYFKNKADNSIYINYLPRQFGPGTSITVRFSPKDATQRIVINLLDEPETTRIMHMNMRGDLGKVAYDYYTNGKYKGGGENEPSLPYSGSNLVELSLVAGSHYIDTNANGTFFHRFDVTNRQPTTAVRKIFMEASSGSEANLYSLQFNA